MVKKLTSFSKNVWGYAKLLSLFDALAKALMAMEVTGHYWKNPVSTLAECGAVAPLNPLGTTRAMLVLRRCDRNEILPRIVTKPLVVSPRIPNRSPRCRKASQSANGYRWQPDSNPGASWKIGAVQMSTMLKGMRIPVRPLPILARIRLGKKFCRETQAILKRG